MLHQPKIPLGYSISQRTDEGFFRPATRGDLGKALASKGQMQIIAPELPRPSEMLEGVIVQGRDELTADDQTLHDFLITRAYADDMPMTEETHSLDMSEAIGLLGRRVERSDIRSSLARLKRTTVSYGSASERRFEDVQLLEGWIEVAPGSDIIKYRLPEPLRAMMRNMPSYAYLELAALPKMRSKFSSRLYKLLVLKAKDQPWIAGDDNVISVSGTPDEIADWIGFPKEKDGRVHVGKLRARFLDKVVDDFADVRAFRLEYSPEAPGGRGNPLGMVTFALHLAPPSRHTVPMFFKPSNDVGRIGGKDQPMYRVQSRTWRRAAKQFSHVLGMTNRGCADFWQIALNEALSETALSEGYHARQFRGRRLLDAIRSRGADYAAWGFITEEADVPDLSAKRSENVRGFVEFQNAAELARHERVGFGKRKRGAAPAFFSDAVEEVIPEPVVSTAAPAAPSATFDTCREIILTADDAMTQMDIEPFLVKPIAAFRYTGTRLVTVVVRHWQSGGYQRRRIGCFKVSEPDLDALLSALRRYLEGVEEYAS